MPTRARGEILAKAEAARYDVRLFMARPDPSHPAPTAPTAPSSEALAERDAEIARLRRLLAKERERCRDLERGWWGRWAKRAEGWIRARWEGWVVSGFEARPGTLVQHEPRPLRQERFPAPSLAESELPTVAITTPSFQQAAFLERTIRSVLEQEYPRLAYSVFDGGSTDGSREILERWAPRLSSWRCEKDGGQSDAIVRGFEATPGEIMAYLNSDDLLMPGALRFVGEWMARHPAVDVVYGHRVVIDEEDREIGRWVMPPFEAEPLRWFDHVPQETMFWRRSLYERVGGIDRAFSFAMDWDLILRFIHAGARIVRVPYFLGCFRVHDASKTRDLIHSRGKEEMALIRRREHGRDVAKHEFRRLRQRELRRAAWSWRALQWGVRR